MRFILAVRPQHPIAGNKMSSPFVGQIMLFAGNFAPEGWAICDGRYLPVGENQALFNVIGTTYGGDHSMFALPDLRGRVPLGQGQGRGLSPYQIGQTVGAESVPVTIAQLPPHGHAVSAVDGPGNSNIPAKKTVLSGLGGQAASGQFETPGYAPPGNETALHPASVGMSGGGQAHDNVQPYLTFNFCIALSGANP
jgi:microcystin-dependent protein